MGENNQGESEGKEAAIAALERYEQSMSSLVKIMSDGVANKQLEESDYYQELRMALETAQKGLAWLKGGDGC